MVSGATDKAPAKVGALGLVIGVCAVAATFYLFMTYWGLPDAMPGLGRWALYISIGSIAVAVAALIASSIVVGALWLIAETVGLVEKDAKISDAMSAKIGMPVIAGAVIAWLFVVHWPLLPVEMMGFEPSAASIVAKIDSFKDVDIDTASPEQLDTAMKDW